MEINPIAKFEEWYQTEVNQTTISIPSACCLSTIGIDGYPNARFVSLKEVNKEGFVFTGPLHSRKGQEIIQGKKAALTFWWAVTERQIRIQGHVAEISQQAANEYFKERSREAQLITWASRQGQPMDNPAQLMERYYEVELQFQDKPVLRPEHWSGFRIIPIRIEFLAFSATRFHERTLFTKQGDTWQMQFLQP